MEKIKNETTKFNSRFISNLFFSLCFRNYKWININNFNKMTKYISTSKGNLDMSRGKHQRQLDAIMDNQDKGFTNPLTSLDTTGEEVVFLPSQTTFHTSPVLCKYQKDTCPKNVPKYSMKCIYHKNECSIKKYFDRYRPSDLDKLGIGGLR